MKLLVTGGNGFIGSAVVDAARQSGYDVSATVRRPLASGSGGSPVFAGLPLGAATDWRAAVRGQDVVVHTAGRVHVTDRRAMTDLAAFRAENVDGTLTLARQAAQHGVRRFVFVSTVGVHGAETTTQPFRADGALAPQTPYAISKLEAESGLWGIAAAMGMEVVVVRPPMVYGPNARGNFARLVQIVNRGIPLPFGRVANLRSFMAIDNLVDFMMSLVRDPRAAGHVFLVSDAEDLSTPDLLRRVGTALGRPARLANVPVPVVEWALRRIGGPDLSLKLLRSLQLDSSKTRQILGWRPPISVTDALARAAEPVRGRRA